MSSFHNQAKFFILIFNLIYISWSEKMMTTSSHIIPQNLPFTTAKRVSGGCVNNLLWQICSNQVPPLTGQAHSAMRSGWGWYRRSPHVIETEGPCILEGHGSPDRSYIIPATQCLDCHCGAISIRSLTLSYGGGDQAVRGECIKQHAWPWVGQRTHA